MRIVIIGTGNVATVLGKAMGQAGHTIIQVVGRDAAKAAALAAEWQGGFVTTTAQVDTTADIYVVSVSDAAIPTIAAALQLPGKLVVHTAGAVSKEVLQPCSERYGILYPLQSIRKEMPVMPVLPLLVDAASEEDTQLLEVFANTFSAQVQRANDAQRMTLHVAAVVVSNFTNHLYALAEQYCKATGADFSMLYPLINEVAGRLQYASPAATQTGPAIRGDQPTIHKHLQLLEAHPALQQLYRELSESIQRFSESMPTR